MILYPAIDLKDGRCVRLTEGRMDEATIFNEDPKAQAQLFQSAGFGWLHVVDLNGAIEGKPRNAGAITRILEAANVPVQVGGGVRNGESVEYWLTAGASRVILGTAAVREPKLVEALAREFPERIAVAIDARDGKVAAAGWVEQTDVDAVELARRLEGSGASAFIVTDIGRDGRKVGVNLALVGAVADAVSVPVIASGGVRSVDDIVALRAREGRPIAGAILGRALYDGDIDPRAALEAAGA